MKQSSVKKLFGTMVAAGAIALTGATAAAESYPPTPTTDPSIQVEVLSPVCVADAPYIEYAVQTNGFDSSGPMTMRFFDKDGNLVEERTVPTLAGRTIYPGASVDADGNATDFPGWRWNGTMWEIDPTDQILREGLTVEFEVNPTATASVSYAPANSVCADPSDVAGVSSPEPEGSLPQTGGSSTIQMVSIAAAILGSGLVILTLVRRRRPPVAA